MALVGNIIKGALDIGSAWSSYNSAKNQQEISGDLRNYASQVNEGQQFYRDQLQGLVTNPSSFLDNPLYKAAFAEGEQAVNRSANAKGYGGSGNQAAALQKYGMGFAFNALTEQERILAGLAGLGGSAATGLDTAGNLEDRAGNPIGGILEDLGRYYGEDWINKIFGGGQSAQETMAKEGDAAANNTGQIADIAGVGAVPPVLDSVFGGSTVVGTGTPGAIISGLDAAPAGAGLVGGAVTGGGAAGSLAAEGLGLASQTPTIASLAGLEAAPSLGGAAGAAGGIAGMALPLGLAAYGAYQVIDNLTSGHNAQAIPLDEDQSYFQFGNGNYGVRQGNVVYGTGTDSSKGASNYFLAKPDGETEWLGIENRQILDDFVKNYNGDLEAPLTSGFTVPRNVERNVSGVRGGGGYQSPTGYYTVSGGGRSGQPLKYTPWTPPSVSSKLPEVAKIFEQYGGEAAWGVPLEQWLDDLKGARSHVTGSAFA